MSKLDIVGQKFGRLTVIEFAYIKKQHTYWRCMCECGNEKIVMGKYLTNGDTKSCGCLSKENSKKTGLNNKKHNEYVVEGKIVHVKFSNCDEEFICDIEDWEKAKEITWYKNNSGYVRGLIKRKAILFHDYILDVVPNEKTMVDHINRNKMDNTRKNLRICERQQNSYNHGIAKNNTSQATGVHWHKRLKKWEAYITVERKNISLGCYTSFEDAKKARIEAELMYFKEFSRYYKKELIINGKDNNISKFG